MSWTRIYLLVVVVRKDISESWLALWRRKLRLPLADRMRLGQGGLPSPMADRSMTKDGPSIVKYCL